MNPTLTDARHRLLFGGARDNAETHLVGLGATSILHHNLPSQPFAGCYVDDSTPNRDQVAVSLVPYSPLVIVSLATYENPHHKIPGCAMVWEYYPYPRGDPPTRLAKGLDGYIVQWNFAFPGCRPPTRPHRRLLLLQVQRLHPEFIFLY